MMNENYKYPNIEAERVRMGLSQTEIISRLGYKERKTYYNWLESGNIPVSVLMKMADLFDCSVDYLLGRTRNPVQTARA
jgi:transcriptional regulator with XRE-family HTH domain